MVWWDGLVGGGGSGMGGGYDQLPTPVHPDEKLLLCLIHSKRKKVSVVYVI